MDKFKVKRKICLSKIKGFTISSLSHEFVVHVPSEYDYRFMSDEYRT